MSEVIFRELSRLQEAEKRREAEELYTPEQIEAIQNKMRELRRVGKPEIANALREKFYAGELVEPAEYTTGPITTSAIGLTEEELIPPPEVGKGSGQPKWAAFAERVSDLDPELLRQLGRDDIIVQLKQLGIYHPDDDVETDGQDPGDNSDS